MQDKKDSLICTIGRLINAKDGESYREICGHYNSKQYLDQAVTMMDGSVIEVDPWQHLHLMLAAYTCAINGLYNEQVIVEIVNNWSSMNEYNAVYWKMAQKEEPADLKAVRKSARA